MPALAQSEHINREINFDKMKIKTFFRIIFETVSPTSDMGANKFAMLLRYYLKNEICIS